MPFFVRVHATSACAGVPDFSVCSTPEAIRSMLAESLARLGTDHIDLYYQHRADPNTPIETTMRCLKELVQVRPAAWLLLGPGMTLIRASTVHVHAL